MAIASKKIRWIKTLSEFLLAKFPFINALTLLMLLAERSPKESFPPINPHIIYINLGICVVCGVLMSIRLQANKAVLIYAGQLLYFAYTFYSNAKLNYGEWHRIHIATRHVGCAGIYIMFASFLDNQKSVASRNQLQRIGEILLGIYFFAYMYTLNNSPDYRRAFMDHVPGEDWSRYFATVALAGCALSFISGHFVRDVCLFSSFVVIFMTLVVDGDLFYWTNRGVHYWNQIRMTLDNICAVVGFVYFSIRLENRIKVE
ncbi:transmembrane protein 101 [Patella vulgata]|uniref:transmembrane protein 101 n=1 Tax=Patella vulgata TaxID=6465 RepID=UPI00218074BD|nr:transmembrane protein 101 [Patella vulgata]